MKRRKTSQLHQALQRRNQALQKANAEMREAMKRNSDRKQIVELAEMMVVFKDISFDTALAEAEFIKRRGDSFINAETFRSRVEHDTAELTDEEKELLKDE